MQSYNGRLHGPERLRVYHLALAFARKVDSALREVRCRSSLSNQLIRAVESIILNIAEGAGHFSPGLKRHHYQIAHASADECIAALTRMAGLYPRLDLRYLRRDADMICVMLNALIHRLNDMESRDSS
jgi:four helix bundle protein